MVLFGAPKVLLKDIVPTNYSLYVVDWRLVLSYPFYSGARKEIAYEWSCSFDSNFDLLNFDLRFVEIKLFRYV